MLLYSSIHTNQFLYFRPNRSSMSIVDPCYRVPEQYEFTHRSRADGYVRQTSTTLDLELSISPEVPGYIYVEGHISRVLSRLCAPVRMLYDRASIEGRAGKGRKGEERAHTRAPPYCRRGCRRWAPKKERDRTFDFIN